MEENTPDIDEELTLEYLRKHLNHDAKTLLGKDFTRGIKDRAIDVAIEGGVLDQYVTSVFGSEELSSLMSIVSLPEYMAYK